MNGAKAHGLHGIDNFLPQPLMNGRVFGPPVCNERILHAECHLDGRSVPRYRALRPRCGQIRRADQEVVRFSQDFKCRQQV